jgi:hypothetical protein
LYQNMVVVFFKLQIGGKSYKSQCKISKKIMTLDYSWLDEINLFQEGVKFL